MDDDTLQELIKKERQRKQDEQNQIYSNIVLVIGIICICFVYWYWSLRPTFSWSIIVLFFPVVMFMPMELDRYTKSMYKSFLISIAVMAIVPISLSAIFDDVDENQKKIDQTNEYKAARKKAWDTEFAAQQNVKAFLKDPGSATFRNQHGVCGEVNSKNSFGAMTGYARYVALNKDLVFVEGENARPDQFQNVWNAACD